MTMHKNRSLTSALVMILFSLALPARAESPCKKQTVADLAKQIAAAYEG
jgi:hypothetical protein